MKRILYSLLGTLVVVAAVAASAPATFYPNKGAGGLGLTANATGDTLTANWIWKSPGLVAGDTGRVQWSQKINPSTSWTIITTVKQQTTTSTKNIALPPAGSSDTIRVCVWVTRPGTASSPTVCAFRARATPQVPPPGADSLTLSSVIIKPDSAKVVAMAAGQTVAGDSNTVQFCAGARMADNVVRLFAVSDTVPGCRTLFATVPGYVPGGIVMSDAADGGPVNIGVNLGEPDKGGRQVVTPKVEGAYHVNGEWWLAKAPPVRSIS